jgi:MFS family permease
MAEAPGARLPWYRLAAITFFALALGIVSNTLEPAVLGHKLLQLIPQYKNTSLGLATFAGLLVAALWQPLVGMLSDRTHSRWGRRLPFFFLGTTLVVGCLFVIAMAPSFGLVIFGLLFLQLGTNTVQAPWQALIPDQVPSAQRGRAAGYKAAFDILSFILGRQISGQLVAAGHVVAAAGVAAAAMAGALLLTGLAAAEGHHPAPAAGLSPLASYRVDHSAYPAFKWWFLNRFLFWSGFIGLNTFLLFYMIDVVRLAEPDAQRFVGNLSAVIGLMLLLVALPSGWLADRWGRRPLVIASGLLATAGTCIVLVARALPLLVASGVLIGLSVGIFLSANWALITDIVPGPQAARYLGIANIATAGGSATARLLGGILIDPINRLWGNPAAGYLLLYALVALAFLAGTGAMLRLPASPPPETGRAPLAP